uniref:Toxin candidate TRINITY_DN16292_c0_g1_i2 n=1 Tax=Pachycerianthus borealis TaxID=2736680 RepID=A0A7G7WZ48_9CNID|nr:toxin candidate TRINITY_DN16292_c0_g1_i2 [Pachycerianthus borealis]
MMMNSIIYLVFMAGFFDFFAVGDDVPYISPMILGRTFDKSKSQVGVDIYSSENRKKTSCSYVGGTLIWFKQVETQEDKRNLLDISGQLSLQVKAGLVKVDGKGSYLKENASGKKVKEILVRMERKTVKKELLNPPDANFWKSKKIIGEHFVSAIQYGGLLVASIRIESRSSKDSEDIQAAINANIGGGKKGAVIDLSISGKFKMLKAQTEDKANIEISYFATVPLSTVPTDLESFITLVNNFGDGLSGASADELSKRTAAQLCGEEDEDKIGVPMIALIKEMSLYVDGDTLPKLNFDEVAIPKITMTNFQDRFEDLMEAKSMIKTFLDEATYVSLPDEERLGKAYKEIFNLLKDFKATIAEINLNTNSGGTTADQTLRDATTRYNTAVDGDTVVGKFKKMVTPVLNGIKGRQNDDSGSDQSAEVRYGRLYKSVLDIRNEASDKLGDIQVTAEKFLKVAKIYKKKVVDSFSDYFMYKTSNDGSTKIPQNNPIIFQEEVFNKGNMYNKQTGEMTCPRKGFYLTVSSRNGAKSDLGGDPEDENCSGIQISAVETKVHRKRKDEKITVNSLTNEPLNDNNFMGLFISTE